MRTLGLLVILVGCAAGAVVALVRMLFCIATNPARAFDIAVAFDRVVNAAANGAPTETVSSRANRARSEKRRWGCVLCRLLDAIQSNHCKDSAGS